MYGGSGVPPRPGAGGPGGGLGGPPQAGLGGSGIPPQPGSGGPGAGGIGAGGGFGAPALGGVGSGGGQGFPGAGGNQFGSTGKLFRSINSYYTGVFDSDAKELICVGLRQDRAKTAGELTIYSYPDFQRKRIVHIPNLATRAVVDQKNELLYLTTVT